MMYTAFIMSLETVSCMVGDHDKPKNMQTSCEDRDCTSAKMIMLIRENMWTIREDRDCSLLQKLRKYRSECYV